MAASKKFLIFFISIISILCLVFYHRQKDIATTEPDISNTAQASSEEPGNNYIVPTYTEADTDLNYNYIINANAFKKALSDCPYLFLQTIGTELNEFLQVEEYQGHQLKFNSLEKKGTYINFEVSISDSSDIVIGSYEWGLGEWNFMLKKDGNH